jgi:hypothetical protein
VFGCLTIDGDPTLWSLAKSVSTHPLSGHEDVVSVAITMPLAGTMLLSRRSVTGAEVYNQGDSGEVIPGNFVTLTTPVLYLPSSTGLADDEPVYELPSATNLTTLGSNIAAAMRSGSSLTIDYGSPVSKGILWLTAPRCPSSSCVRPLPPRVPPSVRWPSPYYGP